MSSVREDLDVGLKVAATTDGTITDDPTATSTDASVAAAAVAAAAVAAAAAAASTAASASRINTRGSSAASATTGGSTDVTPATNTIPATDNNLSTTLQFLIASIDKDEIKAMDGAPYGPKDDFGYLIQDFCEPGMCMASCNQNNQHRLF